MPLTRLSRLLLIFILVLGALAVYLSREHFDIIAMEQWVAENPLSAPFLFIILYVVLATLLFPSTLLSLTGGVLFGPAWGTLYILISVLFSAALAFLLARYLLETWVEGKLNGDLRKLKSRADKEGWRFVLLLRIVPGLPFTLLNYALGVTGIRLFHFLAVTLVCLLPRVIFFAYAGDAGKRALAGQDINIQTFIIIGLFATLIVLLTVLKRLKLKGL